MSWIKIINYQEATGKLKRIYNRIKGPDNSLDNVLTIHSLRPHSLEGHMMLYKNVIHHLGNSLPKWYFLKMEIGRINKRSRRKASRNYPFWLSPCD